MTEQLAIVAAQPKLTVQQQAVLAALEQAGQGGLHAEEAGAVAHSLMASKWRHAADARCLYCGQRGLQVLRALHAKGLARYRRGTHQQPGYWQAAKENPDMMPPGMTDVIPY